MVQHDCISLLLFLVATILAEHATVYGHSNLRGRRKQERWRQQESTGRVRPRRKPRNKYLKRTASEINEEKAVKQRFEDLIVKLSSEEKLESNIDDKSTGRVKKTGCEMIEDKTVKQGCEDLIAKRVEEELEPDIDDDGTGFYFSTISYIWVALLIQIKQIYLYHSSSIEQTIYCFVCINAIQGTFITILDPYFHAYIFINHRPQRIQGKLIAISYTYFHATSYSSRESRGNVIAILYTYYTFNPSGYFLHNKSIEWIFYFIEMADAGILVTILHLYTPCWCAS